MRLLLGLLIAASVTLLPSAAFATTSGTLSATANGYILTGGSLAEAITLSSDGSTITFQDDHGLTADSTASSSSCVAVDGSHVSCPLTRALFMVYAGDGNDTVTVLSTLPGLTTINGGSGNDTIHGSGGTEVISGDADDDLLYGGQGADVLLGGDGTDQLYGEDGNDTLDPGPGTGDLVSGGADIDRVTYASRTNPVLLSLDGQANDGEVGEGDNIQSDVENLTGGHGNDTLAGNAAANVLDCGDGTDTAYSDASDTRISCELGLPAGPGAQGGGSGTPTLQLSSTFSSKFRVSGASTRVLRLDVVSVPAGATVTTTCHAKPQRACPFKKAAVIVKAPGTVHLVRTFRHRALRAGTKITILVSAPGTKGVGVTYTTRVKKQPTRVTFPVA